MKIIVGLGNPGREYVNSRHNIGFMLVDYIADKHNIDIGDNKFKAKIGKGVIDGEKVIFAKPQTYMNLSGESVRALVDYFKVDEERDLIVIYDDISMDVGRLRIRKKGSAGGHNGIKNIIAHLGDNIFPRIKVGIGEKPKGWDLADYVLGHFSSDEQQILKERAEDVHEAVKMMIRGELDEAMNAFNGKKE